MAGLCGIPGEPVEKNANTVESTSVVLIPAKRQSQDDDGSHYNQLYKRLEETEEDSGRFMYLLGQGRSAVDDSVRNREFMKPLPSLCNHLQLFPEYRNVIRPALNKIVALLKYRVLQKSKFGGNYVGSMEAKKQEIDSCTRPEEGKRSRLMWQEPLALSQLKLDVGQVLLLTHSYSDCFFPYVERRGEGELTPPPTSIRIAYNYKPRLVKETQFRHSLFLFAVSGVQLSNHFCQRTAPALAECIIIIFKVIGFFKVNVLLLVEGFDFKHCHFGV